jgi:hypothetical protein
VLSVHWFLAGQLPELIDHPELSAGSAPASLFSQSGHNSEYRWQGNWPDTKPFDSSENNCSNYKSISLSFDLVLLL